MRGKPKSVSMPVISPVKSGTYAAPLHATITCIPGAQVFYTLDGTRPVCSDRNAVTSYSYSHLNGIILARPGEYHVCILAVKKGLEPSELRSVTYKVVEAPGSRAHYKPGVTDSILEKTFRRHMEVDRPYLPSLTQTVAGATSSKNWPPSLSSLQRTMALTNPHKPCFVLQDTHTAGSLRALVNSYHGTDTDIILYRSAANQHSVTRVPNFERVKPPNLNLRHSLGLRKENLRRMGPAMHLDSYRARSTMGMQTRHAKLDWEGDEMSLMESISPGRMRTMMQKARRAASSLELPQLNPVTEVETFVFEQKTGVQQEPDDQESLCEHKARADRGKDLVLNDIKRRKQLAKPGADPNRLVELRLSRNVDVNSDIAASDKAVMSHFSLLCQLKSSVLPRILTMIPYPILHKVFQGYTELAVTDVIEGFRKCFRETYGEDGVNERAGITAEDFAVIHYHTNRANPRVNKDSVASSGALLACCRYFVLMATGVAEAPLRFLRDILMDLCLPVSVESSSLTICRMDITTAIDLYRRRKNYNRRVVALLDELVLDPWSCKVPRQTYSMIERIIQETPLLTGAFVTDPVAMKQWTTLPRDAFSPRE